MGAAELNEREVIAFDVGLCLLFAKLLNLFFLLGCEGGVGELFESGGFKIARRSARVGCFGGGCV